MHAKAISGVAAASCLALAAGCGGSKSHSSTGPSGLGAASAEQVRGAVLEGARIDFEGTRANPRYVGCVLAALGRALTSGELNALVKSSREHGRALAAQQLNALAAPAGDVCGGRRYVPELVQASKSLHGDASGGGRSGWLAIEYGPDIGVACRQANSVRCNRLGFDVVLTSPAVKVTVWIAGRRIQVVTPGPTPHRAGARGRDWGGFLQDAGFTRSGSPLYVHTQGSGDYWAGEPPVQADIRITATYAGGRSVSETFRGVTLGAGWG